MSVNNTVLIAANERSYAVAKIIPSRKPAFDATARRLVKDKPRFAALSSVTKVPWAVIAVIKEREAGPDANFLRSIAQGDPWAKKSIHVPKGRGPFQSWHDAGYDALMNCPPYAGRWSDWTPGGTLTILEKYNGLGYAARGLRSPYIWGGTDQQQRGKYVADGKFDPSVMDNQLGCAGMLLAMQEIDPSAGFAAVAPAGARPSPEPPKDLIDAATKKARTVRTAAGSAGGAAGANEAAKQTALATETPVPAVHIPVAVTISFIGVAVAVAVIASVMVIRARKRVQAIW